MIERENINFKNLFEKYLHLMLNRRYAFGMLTEVKRPKCCCWFDRSVYLLNLYVNYTIFMF